MVQWSSLDTEGSDRHAVVLWEDGERRFLRFPYKRGESEPRDCIAVLPAEEVPGNGVVSRLAHEYALRDYLDGAWALRPVELLHERRTTSLLLEYQPVEPLIRLINGRMEIGRFLRLAVGISTAIGRVHAGGLIHRDIKPGNIVVDTAHDRVLLTGFGFASRLLRERQSAEAPELIAGTLAYMAPEQTGRMNRSIDSRSDLYSLGIVLYQMATGALPFSASEPMAWVHCHIARKPTPPCERRADIPPSISAIIMRLLAKTPEERYQTAAGAERDLRRCLTEWESQGRVDEFAPGEHDLPDGLLIPEKLYGRDLEIATLLAAFDRIVAGGRPELVLVSGHPGIGKSALVNELHKPLVPPRGLFASGKFDQYKRDIPYATLAQAFQSLIRPLLNKGDEELSNWRNALREALDPHGLLIVELVPELAHIIGEQLPVPELPPQDAQRRFQLLVRRFIGVFARPEHPLALFLDDLQWLDAATLDLLEGLLTGSDMQHLLLIGAYRDNEVNATHQLMRKLDGMLEAGLVLQNIVLAPLDREDLGRLLSESLRCEQRSTTPLAELLHEKTSGNPFFAIQFLSTLAEQKLIAFDYKEARWSWDLDRIRAKGYTDNVVDLMVAKLHRLPVETQQALQQFACIGHSAGFDMLQAIFHVSSEEMHRQLWEAVRMGLIFRSEATYSFLHDRVHEAAYSTIPEPSRAAAHLRIGRLLVVHTAAENREEKIFEIVNQLNRASSLVSAPEEREQLAEFNLLAGKRAQASSAYVSALNYLTTGSALLPEDGWQQRRELKFALELARAHCEFASEMIAQAEQRLRDLSMRAVARGERIAVACLQVDLYDATRRSNEAVAVGLRALQTLGVDFPERPTEADARHAYDGVWAQLGDRAIDDLIHLPLMSDPDSLLTMDLLIRVALPAHYSGSSHLYAMIICEAVRLGLDRGHSDASCVAYGALGSMAGPMFGQYDAGFRLVRLARELVERPELQRFQAWIFVIFGYVLPWTRPVREGRAFLFRGFDLARRNGEITHAGHACALLVTSYLMAGDSLIEAQGQAEYGLAYVRKTGFILTEGWILGQLGLIRSLRGLTTRPGSFDDGVLREDDLERDLAANAALALPECWYYIRKLQARFLAGEYVEALHAASRAQSMIGRTHSLLDAVEYHFYDALCHAAVHEITTSGDREYHRARLAEDLKKLETWALQNPENFENRAALVAAEMARIEGRDADAMRLYEKAIRSASDNGFVHNEGLAYEVAARFYDARGFEKFAKAYVREARDCYLRWGADAKVRQLDQQFPYLGDGRLAPDRTSTIEASVEHLDLGTVMKVSQATSGEIVLEKLIDTLLRIAVEHAGAERGLLILVRDGEPLIEAEATDGLGRVEIAARQTGVTPSDLPRSVLRYVIRTQERVLLDDASSDNLYSRDEYVQQKRSRSVLCLPIVKQKKLVGALYLENNLTVGAFTPGRVAVLQLLASQAAISLENARLYADLQLQAGLLQRLPVSAWTLSADGTPDFVNEVWLEYSGQTLDFVRSHPEAWMTAVHPEDRDRASRAFWGGVRSGHGFAVETRSLRARDGVYRWHLNQAVVLHDADGKVLKFIGTTTDIDDQKRTEEALRQAQSDLERSNRVTTMGELAASLAHEINQPITAAIAYANACVRWLDREPPNLDQAREAATQIVGDGKRAAQIIARIRTHFEKGALTHQLFDVSETIRETVDLLRGEATRYSISVQTELATNLPPVVGDRVQLQQVVMNLIVNSIEAMKDVDGMREMVITSQRAEKAQILVSVIDTGIGIPPQVAEQIFDPFFTTKPHGTGMGLRISRSIIESHGGRLWAVNSAGRGATLCLSLPAATEG
jgi:PAS domain S-box-containing protein